VSAAATPRRSFPGLGPVTEALGRAVKWSLIGFACMPVFTFVALSQFPSEGEVALDLGPAIGDWPVVLLLLMWVPVLLDGLVLAALWRAFQVRRSEAGWPPHLLSILLAASYVCVASLWGGILLFGTVSEALL